MYIPRRAPIPSAAATPATVTRLFSSEDIAVLSGKPDTGPTPGSVEQLYMPGESLFGAVAVDMRKAGWAVYPQERDERRMPSIVDKRAIKISKYFPKAPTPAETRRWSLAAAGANAAILLGPSSGNTFCLDCDITDPDKSRIVRDLADNILGESPFQRVGTEPKIALFYRTASEADLPRNSAHKLEDGGDQIEILSKGKSITAYGQHHRTGGYFKWFGGKPPVVYGPEHAPLVSPAQIKEFLDAVNAVLPFAVAAPSILHAAFDGAMDSVDGWAIPFVDGDRLYDGREPWLTTLVFETVRQNPDRVASQVGTGWEPSEAGMAAGVEVIMQVCRQHIVLTGRWSDGAPLRHEVTERLRRNVALLAAGGYRRLRSGTTANGTAIATRSFVEQAAPDQDAALWHVPQRDKRASLDFASATMPDAMIATARALQTDRTDTSIRVDAEINAGLDAFFERVYSTETERKEVHVLAAPAGSGKTTKSMARIATDPRTYQYDEVPVDQRPGPWAFLLPTYNNIAELRQRAEILNLDPTLSDEDLAEAAAGKGLMTVEEAWIEIVRLRAQAKGTKLRTMVYKGKIAAGCHPDMVPKVQRLSDAGHGSAGLCHARVPEQQPFGTPKGTAREYQDEYCPHYHVCPAIQQRAEIADMHVIFLPHAFMSLSIPEELKNARGVIADERIFTMFVHATEFSLTALRRPRREPTITRDEDALGMKPEDILAQRDEAAWIAGNALQAGKCPVNALATHVDKRPKATVTGLDLVKAAARVTGGATAVTGVVHPGITDHDLGVICEAPTGADVREEYRFWAIIRDRLEGVAEGQPLPAADRKIQYRHYAAYGVDHEMIRISWITKPNWSAAPVLLLDASADEGIIQAIFSDRDVKMHRVLADMNCRIVAVVDKRYSNSSLISPVTAEPTTKAACAANIESVRDRLVFLSAVHANGRIVACAARAVRRSIEANWSAPQNIDWIHFGAERGLNFAERHVAAIVIGRMELPVWMHDGLACALAGDTDPLVLLDPTGTGLDAAGERLQPTMDVVTIRRRDGADLGLLTARNPRGWLRIVQDQFREEGILQALCRVRPVYREDTPVVYLFCQSIPESLIVDEICSGEDLRPGYQALLEACRMTGGIIDFVVAADQRDDIGTEAQFKAMFMTVPKELKASFSIVDWTPADGSRTVHAGVPAYIPNPVAAVAMAIEWAGVEHDGAPVLVRQADRVEPAAPRPIDDLVIEAGSFEDRRARERAGIEQAVERLVEANLYVPAKGKHPAGPGDLAGIKMWLTGHALVHGIADPKAGPEVPISIVVDCMDSEAIAV